MLSHRQEGFVRSASWLSAPTSRPAHSKGNVCAGHLVHLQELDDMSILISAVCIRVVLY
jgi:hypothetical protein